MSGIDYANITVEEMIRLDKQGRDLTILRAKVEAADKTLDAWQKACNTEREARITAEAKIEKLDRVLEAAKPVMRWLNKNPLFETVVMRENLKQAIERASKR